MKNILIAAVVGLVIGGLAVWLISPHSNLAGSYPAPAGPPSNFSWVVAAITVDSPLLRYADVNGNVQVATAGQRNALTTATDTPCAIQNPLGSQPNATSSVIMFTILPGTAWPGAGVIQIGTSTSPNGTSTAPFASFQVAKGTMTPIAWDGTSTSTSPLSDTSLILGPNDYVTAGFVASSSVTIAGSCSVIVSQV